MKSPSEEKNDAPITLVDNQRYKIPELNDRELPRVTTITGLLDKSRALMNWSARITAAYAMQQFQSVKDGDMTLEDIIEMDPELFIEEAKAQHELISKKERDRGSRVHEIAQEMFTQMIKGSEIDLGEVDEDLYAPVNALIEWIKDNAIRPLNVEITVWSKSFRGYGGRLDVVGIYNNKLLTIDVKSATGIYDDMKLQVAAYDHAYEERNPGTYTDGAGILRLDKESGMYEFKEYPKKLVRKHLAQFAHLCLLWHNREDARALSKEINKEKREKKKEAKKKLQKISKTLPYEDPF